jgi:hypothetical protein
LLAAFGEDVGGAEVRCELLAGLGRRTDCGGGDEGGHDAVDVGVELV